MDPSTLKGPGVRTGRYWRAVLDRHNIRGPKELTRLRNAPGRYQLFVNTSPRHLRTHLDDDFFTLDVGNGCAEVVVRRYLRMHRERPLWMIFTPIKGVESIVKGLWKKRVISAWRQALQNFGYAADGTGLAAGSKEGSELFGTVQILTYDPVVIQDVPFVDLRQHLERNLKAIEAQLKRPVGASGQDTKPFVHKAASERVSPVQRGAASTNHWSRPTYGQRPSPPKSHGNRPPYGDRRKSNASF